VFGAQKLMDEPKRFTLVAPGYDSVPYRWIGLRYVLMHRYIIAHPDEFGEYGRQLIQLRDRLAGDGRAHRAGSSDLYDVWVLADAIPKASLVAAGDLDWSAQPLADGHCSVSSFHNTHVSVVCDASRSARLVLGEVQAPGWRACVNGAASEVVAFGGVLRSVLVPPGRSAVEFLYEPVPFLRGIRCS
jgi:hypothetical protein